MKKILVFSTILLVFSACKKTSNPLENYDRATLLKSLADNVITPAYLQLNTSVAELQTATNTFVALPNSANLQVLQAAFDTALMKWELCEAYNVGYALTNNLPTKIAATPANVAQIEIFIHDSSFTMNQTAVANTGSTRKGFAAIEYLIFGQETAILDSLSDSRRRQYLQALVQDLQVNTTAVYNDWNGGNSYTTFVSNTQLDVSGSLNLLVNALVGHIEAVRTSKVGKPAGIESSVVDGSACEYIRSQNSLNSIRSNNQSWKALFDGNGSVGLNDYLDYVNAKYNDNLLSSTITNQFETIKQKADAVNVPLDQAVISQSSNVSALHLELKKLTVLSKVDAASNLGVIITFSDNDGD